MRFLAISYDTDEQLAYHDHIEAADESSALEAVGELRPDCLPVSVLSRDDLINLAIEITELEKAKAQS
jgi:hypothetical protein